MVKMKVNHAPRQTNSPSRRRICSWEIFRKLLRIVNATRWAMMDFWLRKWIQLCSRNLVTSSHSLSHREWDLKGSFNILASWFYFINLLFSHQYFSFSIYRDTQQESSRSPTPLTQPNLLQQQLQQQLNVNNHHNGRSKRFSSPAYSDYGYSQKVNSRNGKIGKRSVRSMNEAIEVLADQVEEQNLVSLAES